MVNVTLEHPEDAAADWTIAQGWENYSSAEHAMWNQLFERQTKMLHGRAAPEFLEGLDILRLSKPGIPNFDELSDRLMNATGWQVVAVPGLVPDDVFFDHLANRRFVSGNFIRAPEQVDYLQKPDIFHDVFGHVPLLANPVFADYMQAYGKGGQRAQAYGTIDKLARLYWYTVEFGLIDTAEGLRIFGAGIVSSYGESIFALDNASPNRLGFDLRRLMRTRYHIDDFQQTYFVIDNFDDLLEQTLNTDFAPLYVALDGLDDYATDVVLSSDRVISRGTQNYPQALGLAT